MAIVGWVGRAAVATLGVLTLVLVAPGSGVARAAPAPTYYLALGDSLSTGGGATPGHGYVNDLYNFAKSSIPGLQLENLGCGGDSTTRMIHGGLCHDYATGNQLGDAERFLALHPGQVAFVTIDIGGDDIVGCALNNPAVNLVCVENGLNAVAANLPVILGGLRQAGGAVPIVAMTYYDPILAAYLPGNPFFSGESGSQRAHQSIQVLDSLNGILADGYSQYDVAVAKVVGKFDSHNWRPTGSFNGQTLPQNVANVCNWTHMCLIGGGNPNIHANDTGHGLIAAAFEQVLGIAPSISGTPPGGSAGAPYSFQFDVSGVPSPHLTVSGHLPRGIGLSGAVLSGTPARAGTYAFVVTASNGSGRSSDAVSLTVS